MKRTERVISLFEERPCLFNTKIKDYSSVAKNLNVTASLSAGHRVNVVVMSHENVFLIIPDLNNHIS